MEENKIYICLENGNVFEGKSFGAKGEVIGELVFTTGMGGYIETLTDPSYFGQIVMQTFPLIGNLLRKIRKAKNPLYLRI
jgi:carbamoyl-phosphate synthase small subunit